MQLECAMLPLPAHTDQHQFEVHGVAELLRRHMSEVDRLVVVSHGHLGGSGGLHALARACGLPVLGPDAMAIAGAYDKLEARRRLAHHNLPVPRTVPLIDEDQPRELARLGWPCVLKPRRGASGAGVRRIFSADEARRALADASRFDADLLLEREVVGREYSLVVIDGRVLGIAEIDRELGEQGPRVASMVCPPLLDDARRAGLVNLALRSCEALHLLDGPTRVDLMVSERDNEVVLEVEPLPPLHRDSVVARVARAAGLPYPALWAKLLSQPLISTRPLSPTGPQPEAPSPLPP